jgi:hypothetical protein
MRKITLLLLCIATLGLASCQKENYINNGGKNITLIKTVQPNQWSLSNDGYTYSTDIIDSRIGEYEEDGILVYIIRNNQGFYEQIPFVYDTQSYSYTQNTGSLTLDIQSADVQATAPIRPTAPITVKIVMIESQFYD